MTKIYQLTNTRFGTYLYNSNDTYIGKSLLEYGEWSYAEVVLFDKIIREGDVVVEAGANIGSHTVFLSKKVGQSGKVLAFEPARFTYQTLCANLLLNDCLNAQAFQKAVGDQNTTVEFPILDPQAMNNFGCASLLRMDNKKVESCQQITLDSLSFEKLDFIKADIEGYEPLLLHGAKNTVLKHRPVIYLEIGLKKDEVAGNRDELVSILNFMNYSCYYYITPIFNPENFKKNAKNIYPNQVSIDMICVPNEKASLTGLTQAKVNDGNLTFNEAALKYTALPWAQAQFKYLNK